VGSLKLLQDLNNKEKTSQTRLRFVICLVCFLANFSLLMTFLHMVCRIDETYGSGALCAAVLRVRSKG
jgi:hypothetical protein